VQPPASLEALADPIYEVFYGLVEQPFAITTDPKFFYPSASHQFAYNELLNGMRRREGLQLLTGETGTGKTTLCRAVIQALGPRTFSAMILNPYMAGAEVFRLVLRDFGLVNHEELRRGALASADIPQLLDTLEGFLRSLLPLGTHAVIVLDEAQSVSPETLDQLRLLTGLEDDGRRLVQLLLCGQPPLLNTLKAPGLMALNERITRRLALAPLTPEEVVTYIGHRLAVAGGAEAVSFDAGAAELVSELSHGLPRRINVLCDRALQEGRIEGVHLITAALVKRAARAVAGAYEPARMAPSQPVKRSSIMNGWNPWAADESAGAAARKPWRRWLGLAGAALAVAGAAASWYTVDASRTLAATAVPDVQAPVKVVGAIPSPISFAQAITTLTGPAEPRPRPRPAVPASVAAIPAADVSAQFPDDRDELN
jgi:general secretion pathway protein A